MINEIECSMSFSLDAYQAWRQRQGSDCLLNDLEPQRPKELLLQYIWQHQRLMRDGLQTVDGRRCEVLHPGFWNHGPGPDFSHALIRVDGGEILVGDVEIDCEIGGWKAHGHDRNPSFSNVIMQVVWAVPKSGSDERLILAMDRFLDAPLEELSDLFSGHRIDLPEEFVGKCCSPLFNLPLETARSILRSAATLRFRQKAELIEARARRVGWRLSLWEGMLSGLGYSKNSWPMRRIGEMTPYLFPEFPSRIPDSLSVAEVEARLFGVAGFLPKDPSGINAPYLNQLWDVWWRIRDELGEFVLPRSIWRIAGMRPHNHPHRRLALVAQWLLRPDFFQSIEWWFTSASEKNSLEMLGNALSVIAPPFWSSRFNFSRISLGVSPHLIGEARMNDLAINIILPWFWVRARAGRNQIMMDRAERLFLAVPRAEENRRLKDGRTRLMGRSDPKMLGSAADQQGLLQILRDFCAHSNSLCEDCRFPSLVRSAGAGLRA